MAVCDHLKKYEYSNILAGVKKPSNGTNTRARTFDKIIEICDILVLRKGQHVILTILEYKRHYYISNGMQRSK